MTTSTHLSRRSMLASVLGGVVAGLPVVAAASVNLVGSDERLIRLCDEWLVWNKRYHQLGDELTRSEESGAENYQDLSDGMFEHVRGGQDIWDKILLSQATTMRGVMAKAAVLMGSCADSIEGEISRLEGGGHEPNNMALSFAGDFLAVTNAGLLS